MNKCLVTKLGTTINAELPNINELYIDVNLDAFSSVNSNIKGIVTGNNLSYRIVGDGHWCDQTGNESSTGDYLSVGQYKVGIKNYIDIKYVSFTNETSAIEGYPVDSSIFKKCKNIERFSWNTFSGEICFDDLGSMTKLIFLYVGGSVINKNHLDIVSDFAINQIKSGRNYANNIQVTVNRKFMFAGKSMTPTYGVRFLSWSLKDGKYNLSFGDDSCKIDPDTYEITDMT